MTARLLRLAGGLAIFQGLAHGILIVLAKPKHGPEEVAVVEAMKDHAFSFAGSLHSYWDMYFGYAMMAAGTCVVEGVLLWLLAPMAPNAKGLRAVLLLLIAANVAHAMVILRYFFLLPLVFDGLVALLIALAVPGWGAAKGVRHEIDHHAHLGA